MPLPVEGGAAASGVELYHEIHGSGKPLVLLHGALSTIEASFGSILPALAESRQVIAVEQQGHGHTADIDRPLTYPQMAADTAGLLTRVGVKKADFLGYSMGAGIAVEIAIRFPRLVDRLVLAAFAFAKKGLHPEIVETIETTNADSLAGSVFEAAYARTAPDRENWPVLIAKVNRLDREFEGWAREAIHSIEAPTLLIIGDSDIVRPEHAVETFRLLGGGVEGDSAGLPRAQLAVLPGTTHLTLVDRSEWVVSMTSSFLTTQTI
jgi:pimeloyl-ACP methyl ester carboxylesterase